MFWASNFCSKWRSKSSLSPKTIVTKCQPDRHNGYSKFQHKRHFVVLTDWFLLMDHESSWWAEKAYTERPSSALESSETILSRNLPLIDKGFTDQKFVRTELASKWQNVRSSRSNSARQNFAVNLKKSRKLHLSNFVYASEFLVWCTTN